MSLRSAILPVLLTFTCAGAALGAHGRYLLEPQASGDVFEYTSEQPYFFDEQVYDSETGARIGLMTFDFDTYSGDPDGMTLGGGALAGGLLLNTNATIRDGYSLHFVQIVTATVSGTISMQQWNLPSRDAGPYPDARPTDPAFASERVGTDPPALSLVDYPRRAFAGGDQEWVAELGLVAYSDDAFLEIDGRFFREARVIDTFQWGFAMDTSATPFGASNLSANPAPSGWGAPSATYLDTLNSFYDGLGGGGTQSARFHFIDADDVYLPSPGGALVLSLLAPMFGRRRREREIA